MENIKKSYVINDNNTFLFSIGLFSIHDTNLLLINYYKF